MTFCKGNWPGLGPIYLRVQYCRVNEVDSQVENIDIGLPQGSCLGPSFSCLN